MEKHLSFVELGNRLKKRRTQLGLSQEELAEKIGILPNSYTKIENAFQRTSLKTLIKLAEVLHLSLDYLVWGEKDDIMSDANALLALVEGIDGEKLQYASEILQNLAGFSSGKR